jgi:hypothetical protein
VAILKANVALRCEVPPQMNEDHCPGLVNASRNFFVNSSRQHAAALHQVLKHLKYYRRFLSLIPCKNLTPKIDDCGKATMIAWMNQELKNHYNCPTRNQWILQIYSIMIRLSIPSSHQGHDVTSVPRNSYAEIILSPLDVQGA